MLRHCSQCYFRTGPRR